VRYPHILSFSYCDGINQLDNLTTVLPDLINLIHANKNCDNETIRHLLWDAMVINSTGLAEIVMESDGLIESLTVTTSGGLS